MKYFYLKFLSGSYRNRFYLATFLLMAVWAYLPSLGIAELKSWDEAIYAAISRTIYETGDLFHLDYHGGPYFNKPPLFFYLTVLAYHAGGVNEFTARIISVLWGVGCLFITYHLAIKLFDKKVAIISVLLLLSNYHFFKTVQQGRMESMVAFFIVLACYAFYMIIENRHWIYVFAVAIAIGVLTKGAMGLIPFIILLPFVIAYPHRLKAALNYHSIIAFVIAMILMVPWYYYQLKCYGDVYIDQAIKSQLINRISKPIEGHSEPFWYYLNTMSLHYFSNWSLLILPALICIAWGAIRKRSPQLVFITLLCWSTLLLFSFGIQTKLPWYIFTIYMPLSIVTANILLSERLGRLKHFIIVTSLISIVVFPLVKFNKQPDSLKAMKPNFEEVLNKDTRVFAFNIEYPVLNYYTDANPHIFYSLEKLMNSVDGDNTYIVLRKDDFAHIDDRFSVEILAQNLKYCFFKVVL